MVLTPREAAVQALRDAGLTQREIAEELGISIRTVQKHCGGITDKTSSGKRRRRARSAPRYVYFLRAENGAIKIGCAVDYMQRSRMIAQCSPIAVTLIRARRSKRAQDEEKELLQRFASSRIRGEWFRETPELLAELNRL